MLCIKRYLVSLKLGCFTLGFFLYYSYNIDSLMQDSDNHSAWAMTSLQ